MGVNSLPKTATRQHRGCDLNPDRSAPESSTLTTRLPSCPVDDKLVFLPPKDVLPWQRIFVGLIHRTEFCFGDIW